MLAAHAPSAIRAGTLVTLAEFPVPQIQRPWDQIKPKLRELTDTCTQPLCIWCSRLALCHPYAGRGQRLGQVAGDTKQCLQLGNLCHITAHQGYPWQYLFVVILNYHLSLTLSLSQTHSHSPPVTRLLSNYIYLSSALLAYTLSTGHYVFLICVPCYPPLSLPLSLSESFTVRLPFSLEHPLTPCLVCVVQRPSYYFFSFHPSVSDFL